VRGQSYAVRPTMRAMPGFEAPKFKGSALYGSALYGSALYEVVLPGRLVPPAAMPLLDAVSLGAAVRLEQERVSRGAIERAVRACA
jgi:hypothetical protein